MPDLMLTMICDPYEWWSEIEDDPETPWAYIAWCEDGDDLDLSYSEFKIVYCINTCVP